MVTKNIAGIGASHPFASRLFPLLYFSSGHQKKWNHIWYDDDLKRKCFGKIIDNLLDLACLVSCGWLDVELRLRINDKYFGFGIHVTLLHATTVSTSPFPP